jgi:ribonuclease T2
MFMFANEYTFLRRIVMFCAFLGLFGASARAEMPQSTEKTPQIEKFAVKTKMVLGISWHPGFCEKRSKTPECIRQTSDSLDARQFSLSGLWSIRKTYCGVETVLRDQDKKKDWLGMPELALDEGVRLELAGAMPGVASGYDRHQWVKYGTCSGLVADDYYGRALRMLAVVNESAVQRLFIDNLGATIREADVKAAFDQSFGPGAGNRVKMRCSKDGDRRVITGLTIGLGDATGDAEDLSTLVLAAGETKFGCAEGVVDEAGLQ